MFKLPRYHFLFPDAPFPHPQVPAGRAWYALDTSNYQGLEKSRQLLLDWLLSLENLTGVPLTRTVLSGFSQGGALTLDVGLSLPLAGLCCLSGYLHSLPQVTRSSTPPVFMVHGRQDLVVPLRAAQQARDELIALGVAVDYHEFDMGHEVPPVVLGLMQQFITTLST